jgi:hypothetical protein
MNLFNWKNKCEKLQINLEREERENKRLKSELKWMRLDFENMFEYVKENFGQANWEEFAKDFNLCQYCGYNYESNSGSHFNWSHQECPQAFIQNCEDFIEEVGNGNSTRSLVQSLYDDIKRHGDMESRARNYHEMREIWHEKDVNEDFDEYLKESGNSIEDIVWDGLWSDGRDSINRQIVEYWIADHEENIGPIPPELRSDIWW